MFIDSSFVNTHTLSTLGHYHLVWYSGNGFTTASVNRETREWGETLQENLVT